MTPTDFDTDAIREAALRQYECDTRSRPADTTPDFDELSRDRQQRYLDDAEYVTRHLFRHIRAIAKALGTDADGDDLIEVASHAHAAEQELAALLRHAQDLSNLEDAMSNMDDATQ